MTVSCAAERALRCQLEQRQKSGAGRTPPAIGAEGAHAPDREPLRPATEPRGDLAGRVGRGAVAVAFALALAGCAVGPRYVVPDFPSPAAYKEAVAAPPEAAGAGSWQPAQPQDAALKGKWWEIFAEPELDALEER